MDKIVKCTETYISEFTNTDVLNGIESRNLNDTEQARLFKIAESYESSELFYSKFNDINSFVSECVRTKKTGIIDVPLTLSQSVSINGSITLKCLDGVKINVLNGVKNLFLLNSGEYKFENFDFDKSFTGNTFYTNKMVTTIQSNKINDMKITNAS